MIYDPAPLAVILFISIVALVLGISIFQSTLPEKQVPQKDILPQEDQFPGR